MTWGLCIAACALACSTQRSQPQSRNPQQPGGYAPASYPAGTPPPGQLAAAPTAPPQGPPPVAAPPAAPWLLPGAPPPWWPGAPPQQPPPPGQQPQTFPFPFPPGWPAADGCIPPCGGGQVCVNGGCACPHQGDVLCAKGCTNPSSDNFACGCTAGGTGTVCSANHECCGGRCLQCPAGQKVDPASCGCQAAGGQQPTLYLLTNSSNGTFFGTEAQLQGRTRCSFEGGGIDCKPTDVVTYQKLLEPSPSEQQTRDAACKGFSKKHFYPVGIGWKGFWTATGQNYGLWDDTVGFLHQCVPDGPA